VAMVSLPEAKSQLRIDPDDTSDDAELQAYCDGITGAIEDYKHEVIEAREIREDVERFTRGGRQFRLWSVPVISITSVTSLLTDQTWDVAALRVTPASGLVRVLSGPPVRGLVEVIYQAGYATIPPRYKRGALVVLQHNWELRKGANGGGRRSNVADEGYDPRWSYSIPRRALEWLGKPNPIGG